MGLAAPEGRLQVNDRLGVAIPAQAPGAHPQEGLETLGEVGALVEAGRGHVLLSALALGDLVEVGGELGLPEVPGHDVAVGADHLAPGGEPVLPEAGHGDGGGARVTARGRLVGAALDVEAQLADAGGGLRGADGLEEPLGGVQGAVGVVGAELGGVRPGVADLAQLPGQVLLAAGEDPAEEEAEAADALGNDPQLALQVTRAVPPAGGVAVLGLQELRPRRVRRDPALEDLGDPGAEHLGQDHNGLADAGVVGGRGHVSTPRGRRGRWRSGRRGLSWWGGRPPRSPARSCRAR